MKPIKFPEVKFDYRAMAGGLDLVTPRISLDPGKCFDAQNYEPLPVGGYRRISGFERYDGRASPTSAVYYLITCTFTGTVTVGITLTGGTSGATGKVLAVLPTYVIVGRVTGTFVRGETLLNGATPVATATVAAQPLGSPSFALNADYKLLAANDLRGDIGVVPGGGPVRGVFVLLDTVYALRDNAAVGATAQNLYRATAGGWVLVGLGTEIQFTAGVVQINDGDTITGGTSGATATVRRSMLRSGTWGTAGVGTLVITVTGGTWQNGEAIKKAGVTCATSASLATAITRLPGGNVEVYATNFAGAVTYRRAYGCDGVNLGFEFDGTYYCPIRTGMASDTPNHVYEFRNYLFFAFQGSIQFSGVGQPYAWSPVLGSGEIAVSSPCSGFTQMASTQSGGALGIFTQDKQYTLYGTSSSTFVLMPSNYDIGFQAKSIQGVANGVYGMTARGLQSLVSTLNYGDFEFAALSFFVQPLINPKVGQVSASVSLRTKNQYRIFFTDGTGFVIGLSGEKISGIMPLNYTKVVRCICNANLTSGVEVCYFGSDDGYVYQSDIGTSMDGSAIEAWIRPAFNNLRSPLVRKTYRRAKFEVDCEGFSQVNIAYDIGYANPDTQVAAQQPDQQLAGAGAYWDQMTWDVFAWDNAVVKQADISIDGTDTNIAFLFYSNRAQDDSHTVQGVNLLYTPRRLVHSGS